MSQRRHWNDVARILLRSLIIRTRFLLEAHLKKNKKKKKKNNLRSFRVIPKEDREGFFLSFFVLFICLFIPHQIRSKPPWLSSIEPVINPQRLMNINFDNARTFISSTVHRFILRLLIISSPSALISTHFQQRFNNNEDQQCPQPFHYPRYLISNGFENKII